MSGQTRALVHDRRVYGLVSAIVVKNGSEPPQAGEEAAAGRVKVVYPWYDGGSTESPWCRVLAPYAGNGYGAVWTPEVGDEVAVLFVQGDMRLPIVVGGLYNGDDRPPSERTPELDRKLFRTKAGHVLQLEDTERARNISLTTAGGMKVVLDDAAGTLTIDTATGQRIVLDGGTVTITGGTVKLASGDVQLGNGAGEPAVLGNALLQLFNSHTHNCTAPGTPSGPPVPLMTPTQLSTVTKTA